MTRLPWPRYFMEIAHLVADRSTCLRRKVGAVAVKDKRILATGYNGAPTGLRHCRETGCLREQIGVPSGERHELCRSLHAEQNVIIQAAVHGIPLAGADLYCTDQPCLICAKMLINANFRKIYFAKGYPDELAVALLDESATEYELLEDNA
ncbi:MAG: dCMP deaminase family protein [Desulfohalobiaceae bacterium]|nr:dCMP deaminase family protein [Desulfohalobiaceae bacterium]